MSEISVIDTSRHAPDCDDCSWQESFFLGWTDVRQGVAGHHHISLCPYLGKAHVWSWLMVDGKEVAREQEHALDLPVDDLRDMRIGGLHFVAGQSIRELALSATFSEAQVDVAFEGFTDPVHIEISAGKLKLGSKHYESMGTVRGTVRLGDRVITVNGSGWQDHSWGPRRLSSNPAGRWVFAVFGSDLAFSLYVLAAGGERIIFGYALDQGEIHLIESAETNFTISDDGISALACDARIWTKSGRGYRIVGEAIGHAPVGGPGWTDDGLHWWMDGLARFECGGRLGSGILEVSTLKAPTEIIRRTLRLPQ